MCAPVDRDRVRSCAALAAREGELTTACQLLRLSLEYDPPGEAAASVVHGAVLSVPEPDRGEVERWRLDVAQLCAQDGCWAPWPPVALRVGQRGGGPGVGEGEY